MSGPERQADLFPHPDGSVVINGCCVLMTAGSSRVVVVSGIPIAQYALGDRMAEAHAMATIVQLGRATRIDVARAFRVSTRTVRRFLERLEGGGLAALGRAGGFPIGRKRLSASRERRVRSLKAKGISNRAIAARVGVTENAIREQLVSRGWKDAEAKQGKLALEAPPAQLNLSADQTTRLRGCRTLLRQVTRLSEDRAHQTPIVTSRRDLSPVEVAHRMFERWRQENFFKYLRDEYALDALVDHEAEPADPERSVPNPELARLDAEYRRANALVTRLSAQYGLHAHFNPESLRRTVRGFKIAMSSLGKPLRLAMKDFFRLKAERAKAPKRVPVAQTVQGNVVKLSAERKHLSNVFKMVAYQAESDLVSLIAAHYKRADQEVRTLIQSALAGAADIAVAGKELRVTIAALSSAHRTKAVASLCAELNKTAVLFPGTDLRLRYSVETPK